MDLENLTKQQIILLTLLVSFVTSIATGIVTVTLMDQTPPGVTRTVNRVIERTVEKVVPDSQGASVITKEKTVIVKEEDLITDLIKKGSESIVKIYERPTSKRLADKESLYEGNFVGIGTIISVDGVVVFDKKIINRDSYEASDNKYFIKTNDNKLFDVKVENFGDTAIFMSPILDSELLEFDPVEIMNPNSLKLGQSVIVISEGKEDKQRILTGIVSAFDKEEIFENNENSNNSNEEVSKIETNIIDKIFPGTPLFNLFGSVIAVSLSSDNMELEFIPAIKIKSEYNEFKNSENIDSN